MRITSGIPPQSHIHTKREAIHGGSHLVASGYRGWNGVSSSVRVGRHVIGVGPTCDETWVSIGFEPTRPGHIHNNPTQTWKFTSLIFDSRTFTRVKYLTCALFRESNIWLANFFTSQPFDSCTVFASQLVDLWRSSQVKHLTRGKVCKSNIWLVNFDGLNLQY